MLTLSGLRNRYGGNYVTVISDDLIIPWRPLSIGQFIDYDERIKRNEIAPSVFEDEIFKSCVTNNIITDNMSSLPAGVITTVVQNIFEVSGPIGIDHFNQFLAYNRQLVSSPMHQMVGLIIRAFQAYTPEDIYNMPYEIFMLRLAHAEDILLKTQQINEPIQLLDPEEAEKLNKRKGRKLATPPELRALWEKQNTKRTEPVPEPKAKTADAPKTKTADSPIFDKAGKARKVKGLDNERMAIENSVGSAEETALRANMVAQMNQIYAPVIDKLTSKK